MRRVQKNDARRACNEGSGDRRNHFFLVRITQNRMLFFWMPRTNFSPNSLEQEKPTLALKIGFFTAQIQRCRHNRNGFPRFSSSDSGRAILADNSWDSNRLVSNLRPAKEDPCMDEVMPKKVGLDL